MGSPGDESPDVPAVVSPLADAAFEVLRPSHTFLKRALSRATGCVSEDYYQQEHIDERTLSSKLQEGLACNSGVERQDAPDSDEEIC